MVRVRTLAGLLLFMGAGTVVVHPQPVGAAKPTIGPPTNVQITPVHTALSVSWTPATNGASQISGYIVTATHRGLTSETCEVYNPQTSCAVGGLVNGKRYRVSVQPAAEEVTDGGPMLYPIGKASNRAFGVPTTAQNCAYLGEYANLQGCDLTGATLSNMLLYDADFEGTELTDADLDGANLAAADLSGAILTGANLSNTFFNMSVLTGESFADVQLFNATFDNESYPGMSFAGAEADEITFISGTFDHADLAGASLENSHFDYSSFTGADFDNADLTDASIGQDDLTGATFSGTTVAGVAWNYTTCPDGTSSTASSPQTCDGHGD
jgi:uncharacterized protein YjbI with pentapeptide repeats